MRTTLDRDDSARFLRDLAACDGVRVVVATRSLASGRSADPAPWRRSNLVRQLFPGDPRPDMLVDLDTDEFFAAGELVDLVEHVLANDTPRAPAPPTGAWQAYRDNDEARHALAVRIQQRAGRNYMAAVMTAMLLATDDEPVDDAHHDARDLPDNIGDVFDKVISRLGDAERVLVAGLLVALSYGRGSGLTGERWLRFAHALGYPSATPGDIEQLRHSALADYLLEHLRKDGRLLTGLFHRALADHLMSGRDRARDESTICDVLLAEAGEPPWDDGYIRRFLPSHVLAAGRGEEFLALPAFVTQCFPTSLGPVARAVRIGASSDPAAVVRLALPFLTDGAPGNAAAIELAARTQGAIVLADAVRDANPLAEIACVAAAPSQVPVGVFLQHTSGIREVAAVTP